MCGIAGIVNLQGRFLPDELRSLAQQMADAMPHRGPDDSGVWVEPGGYCAFSHRRLSIIDTSSGGHQPMITPDERGALTFNGEIYNFPDIRNELEHRGVRFRSHSDTEVLLEALRAWGADALPRLDAMYAFGYYDRARREILLARDPFGEKPLYYATFNGIFAFASELHVLERLPGFPKEISKDAIAEYLAFQYVPAPETIYKGVKKLPPGSFLTISENGATTIKRYFSFTPQESPNPLQPLDELADELEEILTRSISRRMMSDVPLGAFLSGGVDSSTVVAIMTKKLGRHVKTFSMGTNDSLESEHLAARDIAKLFATEHHELLLTPDIVGIVQRIASVIDEPLADHSCFPTFMLSEFARKSVTVALSGDGGDEMFGGYGRHLLTLEESEQAARAGNVNWSAGASYFSDRILIFRESEVRKLIGEIPKRAQSTFRNFRESIDSGNGPLLSRLRKTDMNHYMPGAVLAKVDRMSMQHALEVRCPILSMDVARFAEKLSTGHCVRSGRGKLVLKEVASRYLPRTWLDRPKFGFGIPTHVWEQGELINYLSSIVLTRESVVADMFGRKGIKEFVEAQSSVHFYSAYQVWSLLLLELWLQQHVGSSVRSPEYSVHRTLPPFESGVSL